MDNNQSSMEERVKALEQIFVAIVGNMGDTRKAISEGFKKIDDNFKSVHSKIDALSGTTSKDFKDVKLKLTSIQDEISKINNVTGYEEAFNNLRAVKGGK